MTPASPSRFYCHSCSTEIDHVLGVRLSVEYCSEFTYYVTVVHLQGFKCPQCLDGFIEELPPEASPPASQDDGATADYSAVENPALRFANELINNPLLTPILMSTSGKECSRLFNYYEVW